MDNDSNTQSLTSNSSASTDRGESTQWQALVTLLATHGFTEVDVTRVLTLIGAPPELPYLRVVVSGLQSALRHATQTGLIDLLNIPTTDLALIDCISTNINAAEGAIENATETGRRFKPLKAGLTKNPLVGICADKYPIYAALAARVPPDSHADAHDYLKSIFLFCHLFWMRISEEGVAVPHHRRPHSILRSIALDLRRISENADLLPLLEDVVVDCPPTGWVNDLETKSGLVHAPLTNFRRCLLDLLDYQRLRRGSAGGNGGTGGHPWQTGYVLNDSSVQQTWTDLSDDDLNKRPTVPAGVATFAYADRDIPGGVPALVRSGLDPADLPSNHLSMATGPRLADWQEAPHGRQRRSSAHACIAVQHLPHGEQILSPTVCRAVLRDATTALSQWTPDQPTRPSIHAKILAGLMLCYGQGADAMLNMTITSNAALGGTHHALILTGDRAHVQAPAQRIEYETLKGCDRGALEQVDKIVMPDSLGIGTVALSMGIAHANIFPIDSDDRAEIKRALSKYIDSLREFSGYRVTQKRLENTLPNLICSDHGPAIAWHVTGALFSTAKARIRYYAPSLRQILRAYETAVSNRMGIDLSTATHNMPAGIASDTRHVGSRICPTTAAVREAIAELQERLDGYPTLTDDNLMEYHNTYTTYTVTMFMLATAYRAVNSISPPTLTISRMNGLHVYIDKSVTGTRDDTRVGILPDAVKIQLDAYAVHIAAMAASRGWLSEALRGETGARFILMNADRSFSEFSIGEYKRLQPHSVSELPPNWPRHYMANALINMNIPYEHVEAYLGHGIDSERYSHGMSAIALSELANVVSEGVCAVLSSVGARSIQSVLTAKMRPNVR